MIFIGITEEVETRFDTSNCELATPLSKGKNKKVMKDEIGGKIMTKFVRLRAKTCSYLIDDSSEDKKTKGAKNCIIKRKFKFENYKNCLEATQIKNKINYQLKTKINIDNLKENHTEFIKSNKLILET